MVIISKGCGKVRDSGQRGLQVIRITPARSPPLAVGPRQSKTHNPVSASRGTGGEGNSPLPYCGKYQRALTHSCPGASSLRGVGAVCKVLQAGGRALRACLGW